MPNVSLTPELERFAESCVQSGRYNSVSEVTRAALRLLQEAEARRTALLASVKEAEAEGERDGFLSIEQVEADLRAVIDRVVAERS
jgi:antitoxin ParD1/3/4